MRVLYALVIILACSNAINGKKFHKKREAKNTPTCLLKLDDSKVFNDNLDAVLRKTQDILDKFQIPSTEINKQRNLKRRRRDVIECFDVDQRLKVLYDSLNSLRSAKHIELCMPNLKQYIDDLLDRLMLAHQLIKPNSMLLSEYDFDNDVVFINVDHSEIHLSVTKTCKYAVNVLFNFKSTINLFFS